MPDDIQDLGAIYDAAQDTSVPSGAPAPEATPTPTPGSDPPPSRSTIDYFQSRGYDVSQYQSDDDWFSDAERFEAERQANQAQLIEFQRNRDQYLEWQKAQQKPPESAPAPVPAPPQSHKTSPLSETAQLLFENGGFESHPTVPGLVKAKDPYMQRYAEEINQRLLVRKKRGELILDDPEKFFEETGLIDKFKPQAFDEEALLAKAEERALAKFRAEIQASQQVQTVRTEFQKAQPLLYQMDQSGQPVLNAAGHRIPTPLGQSFEQALGMLKQRGIADEATQVELALGMVNLFHPQQKTPPTPQTVQDTKQAKQETWLQTTARNGNRLSPDDATILEAARAGKPSPNGHHRLGDIYDQAHRETLSEMR